MRSTPPCRIASAIGTARLGSRLLHDLAVGQHDIFGLRAGERRSWHRLRQAQQLCADRIAAAAIAVATTEAAIHEPPSTGACGSVESPSLHVMFSIGSPSMSAATCAMIV